MTARAVQRLRLTAVAVLLVFMVFAQSAGNTVADTKIDLVVDPARFLSRALRLWDPIGNGGQLQNQAYGYLFPMGPFYALGHWVGLAPWVVQRSFESAVVVAAFLGVVRLSRLLGMPGFWPRVAAGLVFALAPRTLSELTSISSELMPVAALPWMLVPLVSGSRSGSPRRAAMRSGVAVLFAGGVNAAATIAVLPVPLLWLVTRPAGRRKRELTGWWIAATGLATAWWLVPLLLLGRYSPPFLDWIEAASATTVPTSLQATLRGADQWVSYLGPDTWPGGWILAAAPLVIVATVAVAAAGLAGLARRDVRHRTFLLSVLACGLIAVTFGHLAPVGPPGAAGAQRLLNGALVAFRNVHKFDPLVRLPLAIGFGHLLARSRIPARWHWGTRGVVLPARALGALLVACIGVVAVTPALTGQLATKPRVTTEPGWWRQAAAWLAQDQASSGGRALVVPGSASPVYLWGSTVDDALQPVATTPWALRNAVPLAPAGYIRLLDEVEASLAAGQPDPTLAPLLRRSGISSLVLRNDLSAASSQAVSLSFVRATLDSSAGLALAAQFGPEVNGNDKPANLIDVGLGDLRPSVQIYRVLDPPARADVVPSSSVVRANGSADDLPGLLAAGLPPDRPVLFAADDEGQLGAGSLRVLTDGIRKRQASFGGLLATSNTMTEAEPYLGERAAYDYLPPRAGPLSAWRYAGISDVRASSSGSDLLAFLNRSPAHGPWAAVDGTASTEWTSGSLGGALGQWLEVRLTRPVAAGNLVVQLAPGLGDWPNQLLLSTDAGFRYVSVQATSAPQVLPMPLGSTSRLRITVTGMVSGGRGGSAGIASLTIPGVTPQRSLVVESAGTPDQVVFSTDRGRRADCLTVGGQPACDPTFGRAGEEDQSLDRTFTVDTPRAYDVSGSVRLRPGPELDRLLDRGSAIAVRASSTAASDPRVRPGAVVDEDPTTTWSAAPGDQTPELTLTLARPQLVRGLRIETSSAAPVGRPQRVVVTAGTATWSGVLPADGRISFGAPARTGTVGIRILTSTLRSSTSSQTFGTRLLPVGVTEVELETATPATAPRADVELGCADGPQVVLDGVRVRLAVQAARADVLAGRPVHAAGCRATPVALAPGEHQVALAADATTEPVAVQLTSDRSLTAAAGPTDSPTLGHWGPTSRSLTVAAAVPSVLTIHENANAGWQATFHGRALRPVQLDGWQQGFVLPAGTVGTVRLDFTPQRPFVAGLAGGLIAALLVLVLAVAPRPRRRPGGTEPAALPRRDLALPRAAGWLGGAVALWLLAGWAGPLTLAALAVAAIVVWSWSRGIPSWLPSVALLAGSLTVASVPSVQLFTEANSNLTQLLCVAALAGVFIGDGATRPKRLP